METEYQALTNQNNNISRINRLLEQIGTNSKSWFNKLTFKKSKSDEFLELLDLNLKKILENINLDNIKIQLNKSKKLFEKLSVFKDKIIHKRPRNKDRLQSQIDVIYNNNHTFFPKFSDKIFDIIKGSESIPRYNIDNNSISIQQLEKLLLIQEELISLFKIYYKEYNKENRHLYNNNSPFHLHKTYLRKMEYIKDFISKKINFKIPNDRNITDLFSESESLYNQVIQMPELEINNKKQELSAYIIDLAKFIYKKTVVSNNEILKKSINELLNLCMLYNLIFSKEYTAIRETMEYSELSNSNKKIIPNKETYENLINKRAYLNAFLIHLPFPVNNKNK
jgi:hypothetical protein